MFFYNKIRYENEAFLAGMDMLVSPLQRFQVGAL